VKEVEKKKKTATENFPAHLFGKRRLDQATKKKKKIEKRKERGTPIPSKPTPLMPATQKKCTSLYRFVARITANQEDIRA
jgi:hypothetical protein